MENTKIQVARRRNIQKLQWPAYFQTLRIIFGSEAGTIELIEPSESVVFEKALLARTRLGLSDGSIERRIEIGEDQIQDALTIALACLPVGRVLVTPVSAMDFIFALSYPPSPRQLHQLVLIDGNSVFVVTNDLSFGVGVDYYESEKRTGMCYEVESWTAE